MDISLIQNPNKPQLSNQILRAFETRYMRDMPSFRAWLISRNFFTINFDEDGELIPDGGLVSLFDYPHYELGTYLYFLKSGWRKEKAVKLGYDLDIQLVRTVGNIHDPITFRPKWPRSDLRAMQVKYAELNKLCEVFMLEEVFKSQLEQVANQILVSWAVSVLELKLV